jgi:hypothetical protein
MLLNIWRLLTFKLSSVCIPTISDLQTIRNNVKTSTQNARSILAQPTLICLLFMYDYWRRRIATTKMCSNKDGDLRRHWLQFNKVSYSYFLTNSMSYNLNPLVISVNGKNDRRSTKNCRERSGGTWFTIVSFGFPGGIAVYLTLGIQALIYGVLRVELSVWEITCLEMSVSDCECVWVILEECLFFWTKYGNFDAESFILW